MWNESYKELQPVLNAKKWIDNTFMLSETGPVGEKLPEVTITSNECDTNFRYRPMNRTHLSMHSGRAAN